MKLYHFRLTDFEHSIGDSIRYNLRRKKFYYYIFNEQSRKTKEKSMQ